MLVPRRRMTLKLTSREVELVDMLRQHPDGRILAVMQEGFLRQITVLEPGDKIPPKDIDRETRKL